MPIIPEIWDENIPVTGIDDGYDITELADGRILVSYDASVGGTNVIRGRIYDALGNTVVSNFTMNSFWTAGDQEKARIEATPDGGWIVIYEDDLSSGGTGLRMEVYNSSATRVAQRSIGAVTGEDYVRGDVAVSSSTSALIVYEELNGSSPSDYEFRVYNPATDTIGSAVTLPFSGETGFNSFSNSDNNPLEVEVLSNGNYIISAKTRTGFDLGIEFWIDSWLSYAIISPTGALVKLPTIVDFADQSLTNQDDFVLETDMIALTGGDLLWRGVEERTEFSR